MEVSSLGQALTLIQEKVAAPLTAEQRSNIPKKEFSVSSRKSNTKKPAYPIPDRKHAISALGFSKMHGDAADIAEVRKDVAKKFPDLTKGASVGQALITLTKFAESCVPKKGKEKDGNMGMGTYGPSSGGLPGMVGGPAGGMGTKAQQGAM